MSPICNRFRPHVRKYSLRWVRAAVSLSVLAALSLAVFVVWSHAQRGKTITIHFRNGFGLKPGDTIRHRGIDVGRIIQIDLSSSLESVDVLCELDPSAEQLARVGTQFWIVRPSVSFAGIQGLETIVGGRYIAVMPGPLEADQAREFDGTDEPPPNSELQYGGLEVVLEAEHRQGLDRGTPLLFRGMQVGEVLSVAMAADSLTVETRAIVAADYRSLVRENTVFWIDSGVDVHVGLGGFDLQMGSLETLATGGVSFATPVPPGAPVHTGHRFLLDSEEAADWRDWQPNLIVGSSSLPDGAAPPTLLRAELAVSSRRLGFSREFREAGWLLPLDDGFILGPPGLLLPAPRGESAEPRLAFAGQEWRLAVQTTRSWGGLATMQLAGSGWVSDHPYPRARIRAPTQPENCLLFSDPGKNPISLSQHRLSATESIWEIDPAVSINEDWRGGAVVSREDGCVVGMIDFREGRAIVLPVPAEFVRSG